MPQAIWKGNISFGLVSVPIVLQTAERRSDLSFNLLDRRDHARIRYERVNDQTGEPVPWDQVVKAYEYEDNDYVMLTPADFKAAAVEATQTIDIEAFVDEQDIDPMYYDRPYYLVPGKKGEKPYALLREALTRAKKAGIAKVVIRTKQYLAALVARDQALVLNLLRFHHELRALEEFDFPSTDLKAYRITTKELELADKLIASMATEWKPEQYADDYRDALLAWIDRKIKAGGRDIAEDVEEVVREEEPRIINIADLLAQSVKKAGGKTRTASAQRKTSRATVGSVRRHKKTA